MNRTHLNRVVALVLLLVLLGASASAASLSGIRTYILGQGFSPKSKSSTSTPVRITYSEQFTGKDKLTWYTGSKRYTVTASTASAKKKLRAAFIGACKKYPWKAGSYTIDDTLVFGLKVSGARTQVKTISAFRSKINRYLTERQSAKSQNYILNINSRKFHHMDCSAGNRTSASNRRDVKCIRTSLIAMGYSPCKICNP